MSDKVAIYETSTGQLVAWPNVTSYSWSTGLNDTEGSVQFETVANQVDAARTRPWQYSLAVVDSNGKVLAAGPIYKRDVNFAAGTVQVTAGSFWSLLKKRVWVPNAGAVVGAGQVADRVTDGSVTTYRQTYMSTMDGLAIGLARGQMRDFPGVTDARFPYPSGPHRRTYDGLEMQMVSDLIKNLFDDVNPATVRWDATFDGARFEWAAFPVTDSAKQTWAFSLDGDSGLISEATSTEDYGNKANSCYQVSRIAKGNSDKTPEASKFARYDAGTDGLPRMAVVDSSHENVTVNSTLLGYAQAKATAVPYRSISVTIPKNMVNSRGNTSTICDEIRPGDWFVLTTTNSFYGETTFGGQVWSVSGDHDSLKVSVERVTQYAGIVSDVQPAQGVIQMPPGTAAARIKAFGDFTRRANNPVMGGA